MSRWESRKGFVEKLIHEDSDMPRLRERGSCREKRRSSGQVVGDEHISMGASSSICEPGQFWVLGGTDGLAPGNGYMRAQAKTVIGTVLGAENLIFV